MITLTVGWDYAVSFIENDTVHPAQFHVESETQYQYFGMFSCYDPLKLFKCYMHRSTGDIADVYGNFHGKYIQPIAPESVCNCGGYTTYQSLADHYHSRWCKVNNG